MDDWTDNVIDDDERILELLATSRRIAVLGIKPESRSHKPAHGVPKYMQQQGFEIVPVPVYYPDVTHILGEKVYRQVSDIPGTVHIVNVFRKSQHIPPHLPDLLKKKSRVVWFQLGIRNDEAARVLAEAGTMVVQNRCIYLEHRRMIQERPRIGADGS